MRRTLELGLLVGLAAACGGTEPVMVEPDPLPEGAFQLFTRSSYDRDRGLVMATNGQELGVFFTEQDQDGHRLVFARYSLQAELLSRDMLELGGASGAGAADLVFTGSEYVGIFVRFTEDARTFLLRFGPDGVRKGGVVALNETPLYEAGPVAGAPSGLPRLARGGDAGDLVLIWPAGVGASVVLHGGSIDLESGRVEGQRLMDTLAGAYPAPSRVQLEGGRAWFAWLERPDSGQDRLRVTALDSATLSPLVSGSIVGRELSGPPSVGPGRIAWAGVPSSGGDAGVHLTRTSSGAPDQTLRIAEPSTRLALASHGTEASLFGVQEDKTLTRTRLSASGAVLGSPEVWARKSPVLDLEATRTASSSVLYWEEERSDGVRVGVLRFFEETNDESR